jgi:TetR/AcrR family transcriptional regulator
MTKLANQASEPARDGDTEQRILEAARVVFIRRGTAGARMQEIAAEAGVNQALLHYYFRSKERLAEAVFRHVAGRVVPTVLGLFGSDLTIEGKVEQIVAAYIEAFSSSPFLPGYILSELHHHPERATQLFTSAAGGEPDQIVGRILGKLRVQIHEHVNAGTMRPIAAEQFIVNLLSLCIFPFAAKPFLGVALGLDDKAFARFVDQRKRELPAFFLNALRP